MQSFVVPLKSPVVIALAHVALVGQLATGMGPGFAQKQKQAHSSGDLPRPMRPRR